VARPKQSLARTCRQAAWALAASLRDSAPTAGKTKIENGRKNL